MGESIRDAVARGANWQTAGNVYGYIDRAGAARFLGVDEYVIDEFDLRGALGPRVIGKNLMYSAADLFVLGGVRPESIGPDGVTFGVPKHLYLLEVIGVCVKVGITATPESRLRHHRCTARGYGREIGRVWVSEAHREAAANEFHMKGRAGSEYLKLSFDEALAKAQSLPMTKPEV